MTRHALLDNVSHRKVRIHRDFRPGRGYDDNLARAFPEELEALQNEYPLFFVKNRDSDHFEPVALLGFSEGENLYLVNGRWDAWYRPLTIERQPLLIGFQEQDVDGVPTEVPVVHIDLDHPSVSEAEGEPLFLPHGGESEWLERMTSVLMHIHQGHQSIPAFSQALVGLELIESVSLDMSFRDGSTHTVKGLYSIDEERLSALGGAALETLHKKGYLRYVYLMLASLPNLSILNERKNRQLMAQAS